ncbi:MAG TPA: GNAT family N-acetyltransferase [Candidatus Brocadiia bacterium]|nr:GNAT family N-acetyltransferase [Candidatus Brocadiia bacterium]
MADKHRLILCGSDAAAIDAAVSLEATGRAEIVGFCDIDADSHEAIGKRWPAAPVNTDFAALANDAAAASVVVSGPVGKRAERCLAAIEHKLNVLIPGVMCASTSECRQIVDRLRGASGVMLVCAPPERFQDPWARSITLARSGQLGRIFSVESELALTPSHWKGPAAGEDSDSARARLILQRASGQIALLLAAAGEQMSEIGAMPGGRANAFPGCDDTIIAVGRAGSVVCRLTLTVASASRQADGLLTARGTDATATDAAVMRGGPSADCAITTPDAPATLPQVFLDVMDGKMENPSGFVHAARVVSVCQSISDSIRTRRFCPVERFDEGLPHRQLLMSCTPETFVKRDWPLPPGYMLRAYRPGDEQGMIRALHVAGFTEWDRAKIDDFLTKPERREGTHVVEHIGQIVAVTFASQENAEKRVGCLDFVASDISHKGRGLGCAVCAGVARYLFGRGYVKVVLATDDWRLPAITTYLKIGFRPVLHREDMSARWAAVLDRLDRYDPLLLRDSGKGARP